MGENNTSPTDPIIDVAWHRFAEFDIRAERIRTRYFRLRLWVYILGVFATVLAILVDYLNRNLGGSMIVLVDIVLTVLMVITPIAVSSLAVFSNRFFQRNDWQTMRAGAKEIQKEIYIYRTIMQKSPDRRRWFEGRLANIQRHIYRSLGGDIVETSYTGEIPPHYNPDNPNSDPGFNDLTIDEYIRYRLEDQLSWYIQMVNKHQRSRSFMQISILVFGGLGALMAAIGGSAGILVALAATIVLAFSGWEELRNLDVVIKNYNKVVADLMIIYDHWQSLDSDELDDSEFFHIVRATEDVLGMHNIAYIKAMDESFEDVETQEFQPADVLEKEVLEQEEERDEQRRDELSEPIPQPSETVVRGPVLTQEQKLGAKIEPSFSKETRAERRVLTEHGRKKFVNMRKALRTIDKKYADVQVSKETEKELLNKILSEYPPTGEVKG